MSNLSESLAISLGAVRPLVVIRSETEPLDAFGQLVLDAVTLATAYGDTTTAQVMQHIWRGIDGNCGTSISPRWLPIEASAPIDRCAC